MSYLKITPRGANLKIYAFLPVFLFVFMGILLSVPGLRALEDNDNSLVTLDFPRSKGVDHVGLTIKDLEQTKTFFIDVLGFEKLGEDKEYPAVFLTDKTTIITLWQVQDDAEVVEFDRKHHIGLHHLAFKLDNLKELNVMYERLKDWPGVEIEFAPEMLGGGPTQHMMFYEPGGVRLEFIVRLPKQ